MDKTPYAKKFNTYEARVKYWDELNATQQAQARRQFSDFEMDAHVYELTRDDFVLCRTRLLTPVTPAAFVAAQEWWNLMTAEDLETVRFVDGEPEPSPLDEVYTSTLILYFRPPQK